MWFFSKNYDKIIPQLIETKDSKKLLDIAETAGDEAVISRAALALAEVRDPKIAKPLLYVLKRQSYRGKPLNTDLFEPAIVQALVQIGTPVLADLIFEISNNTIREDWKIRNTAENVIVNMGKPGISALLNLLRKPDIRIKEIAIRLLARAAQEAYDSYAFAILKRDYPPVADPMLNDLMMQKTALSTLTSQPGFTLDESFCKEAISEQIYLEMVSALENAAQNPGISENARKTLKQITIGNTTL
ncbi:MAG: HEAT repeat domain-containing protein [Armatimonadota bacterium]